MITRLRLLAIVPFLLISLPAIAEIPVAGRVTADGEPVAKARALLVPEVERYTLGTLRLTASEPEPVDETESDARGLFELSAPEIGLYRVRIEKAGFAPREMSLTPLVEAIELPDVELEPARVVEVMVKGPDGGALAARVRAARKEPDDGSDPFRRLRSLAGRSEPWSGAPPAGRTSPETPLSLPLPNDEDAWVVEAHAPGWPPLRREMAPGTRGKIELEVRPGVERRLEVVDSQGRPVVDTLVFLEKGLLPLAATDARGRATLLAEGGELALRLLGPGGHHASRDLPPLPEDQAEHVDTLVLEDPLTVSGRVIEVDSRRPIAGALVWAGSADFGRSGADGSYSLTGPSDELAFLSAAAVGYSQGRGRIEAGGAPGGAPAERGPTLALAPAAGLGGVVVDGDGRPLAAVEVAVTPQLSRRGRGFNFLTFGTVGPRVARTSAEGRFEVRGLPLSVGYELRFTRDGLAPAELEIEELGTFEERSRLRIVMTAGRRGVGRVVDESEVPVAGAEVRLDKAAEDPRGLRRFMRLASGGEEDEPGVFTDREGRFVIPDLAPGRYRLQAEAFGYAAATVPGLEIPDGTGDVDLGTLVLSPGAAIEGRVLDAQGLPVAGAEVRIGEQGGPRAAMLLRGRMAGREPVATSDADGRFLVGDQRPGARVDLQIAKEGYVTADVVGVEAPTATPLQVTLQPASRVLGRILDGDGRPLAGATVEVQPERQGGSARFTAFAARRSGTSRDDGTFEVLDVEPGRVTVSAQAPGFRRRELSGLVVPAGEPLSGVELRLLPGAEVRGTVTDADGTPVQGAMVSVGEPDSTTGFAIGTEGAGVTDGDGHYQIAGVGLGPRTVSAMDRASRRVARSVEVAEGTNVVHLVFESGVEVRGHVLDTGGLAIAGASVNLTPSRTPGAAVIRLGRHEAISGADGSFVVSNVEPGSYTVFASAEGFASAGLDDPVTVTDSPLAGLIVRLDRGARLSGRILGLEYDDLVQVRVSAAGGFAEPDFEGRYEIPNLPAGEVSVRAEIPGTGRQVQATVTVPEGVPEVVLDLEFGGGYTLTGVVLHGEQPVAGAALYVNGVNVSHRGDTVVQQDGGFRIEGLQEGRYRLQVSSFDTGLRHTEEIEITGDQDVRIEILTAEIAGRVRDAFDLEPIEGASLGVEEVNPGAAPAVPFIGRMARSDARGHFSLGEVAEGVWKVIANKAGYGPAEQVVEVRAGRAVADLDLAMTATDGLYFEVRMGSGRAARGVLVAFLDGSGQRVAGGTFEATDGGKVRITTVPPGSWEMLLVAEDGATLSLPVTAPGQLGTIVVSQGGNLRITVPELREGAATATVRLVGPDGRPHRGLTWGGTVVPEPTLRGGRVQVANLAAGPWTVTVVAADGRTWSGRADVSPGQTAEVSLP